MTAPSYFQYQIRSMAKAEHLYFLHNRLTTTAPEHSLGVLVDGDAAPRLYKYLHQHWAEIQDWQLEDLEALKELRQKCIDWCGKDSAVVRKIKQCQIALKGKQKEGAPPLPIEVPLVRRPLVPIRAGKWDFSPFLLKSMQQGRKAPYQIPEVETVDDQVEVIVAHGLKTIKLLGTESDPVTDEHLCQLFSSGIGFETLEVTEGALSSKGLESLPACLKEITLKHSSGVTFADVMGIPSGSYLEILSLKGTLRMTTEEAATFRVAHPRCEVSPIKKPKMRKGPLHIISTTTRP